MGINRIEQALSKIQAAAEFYDQLSGSEAGTEDQAENTKLKLKYTREQILKLTLEIKEASEEIENKIEKVI